MLCIKLVSSVYNSNLEYNILCTDLKVEGLILGVDVRNTDFSDGIVEPTETKKMVKSFNI